MSFERALDFTLRWEGGLSEHPADVGGVSKYGITQGTLDEYRKRTKKGPPNVQALKKEDAVAIYRELFWPQCEDFQWPLSVTLFDTRVNFGIAGAAQLIQPLIGAKVDGIWGRETQALLLTQQSRLGAQRLALEICIARIKYRVIRVGQRPDQRVFLMGWICRDLDLIRVVFGYGPGSPFEVSRHG